MNCKIPYSVVRVNMLPVILSSSFDAYICFRSYPYFGSKSLDVAFQSAKIMTIEVEVLSTEIILPSTPTPNDLSNYKLSFPDQMTPPVFMPHTLFYQATATLPQTEIQNRLKTALSKTLSLFYPLAGSLVNNYYVNCNDKGITYVEAKANCSIFDVINNPVAQDLDKLLPSNLDDSQDLCIIQTTFFNCGGLAIGVAVSHKLVDGVSFFRFVNTWAAISRGDDHVQLPIYDGATLFPPRDLGGYNSKIGMESKEEMITKRFMFTVSKINELRNKYSNTNEPIERPTRIEALSAFIWSRLMVSTQPKDDPSRIFLIIHAVNIRKRFVPPLSDDSFGNLIELAIAVPSLVDRDEGTYGVVKKMREAINSINGDYESRINRRSQSMNFISDNVNKYYTGDLVPFQFTSLCNFPLLEADFGLGKPVWIGSGSVPLRNFVLFMDSYSRGGIEAWVTLKIEDMAMFEADEEFQTYTYTAA